MKDYRVGLWYTVQFQSGCLSITASSRVLPAEPVVLAFDIETAKAPLKFPDSSIDPIMMISYMIDGQVHYFLDLFPGYRRAFSYF